MVSDDCLVSRGHAIELKCLLPLISCIWGSINILSCAAELSNQEAVCYQYIAFMTFGSKEKPAKHSPLSLRHFLFFSQIFFYMLLFLPCFSFPQSSEVITVLWSCVMEPAVINLMNSAQSPPFIVLPLKCKLHCVNILRL